MEKMIDPCAEAQVALQRYHDDVKAGHKNASDYWKGQAEAYSAMCLDEPSDNQLLLHFAILNVGSPALVVDEATARATPCTCFNYKGKDICWSKGTIGILKPEEQAQYCVAGKNYKSEPKLTERYSKFAAAAERAHRDIESMPQGMERLETWLSAMGRELGKEGIAI